MTNISVGSFNIIYKEFCKKDIKCQRYIISIFLLLGASQTQQSPLLPEYLLINYFKMIIHFWSEYYILLVKVKSKIADCWMHFLCWQYWHFCTIWNMLAKWADWLTVTISVRHSHWSRANDVLLSLVEMVHSVALQLLLCHKEPAQGTQSP